ncbi:MAG: PrsW family glutamic-type intramembrane protease [Candidatus Moranbacteria bacterium]|nr:PrsW family glutamic-type intramembrane protease [Candidatus Moranbacteria bacterium]
MQKIKPVIFGMLAAGAALVVELVLSDAYFIFSGREVETNYFDHITLFLFIVVLIEESAKYILIKKLYTEKNENHKISTAFLVGLGFATVEFFFVYANQNLTDLYSGAFGAIALHLATTGTIGIAILATKNSNSVAILKTVLTAFGLHIIYNLMVIYNLPYVLIYVYLALVFLTLFILNQKIQSNSKK